MTTMINIILNIVIQMALQIIYLKLSVENHGITIHYSIQEKVT